MGIIQIHFGHKWENTAPGTEFSHLGIVLVFIYIIIVHIFDNNDKKDNISIFVNYVKI